ncbi:MAG: hypothetical protein HYV09_07105 [Deltaproteobacteria bacterium]|nr:hypothetical protein [Deltaproteobacteria bacterium]
MSTTIGDAIGTKKNYEWYSGAKDPSIKLADKAEDKVGGDKYDYLGSTKAGVEEERLHSHLGEFTELLLEAVPLGHDLEQMKGGALLAGTMLRLGQDVAAGKKSLGEATAIASVEVGRFAVETGLHGAISHAGLAMVMAKAVMMAVPIMLEEQKQDEQLMHDEGVRLVVGEHFKAQMPEVTHRHLDAGMSTFGQTYRKTGTFEKTCAVYEGALKADPAVAKAIDQRFWNGKVAVIDLGIKSRADLDKVLDPKNQDPKAVAFRSMWIDKNNLGFRYGVEAMVDEITLKNDPKAQELYAKDLAKYQAEKAALDAKSVPIKS